MTAFSAVLLAATLVISACAGGGNPIIGKWTAADQGGFIVASDVEFTPTEQINGPNEHYAVNYEIKDDIVTVLPKDGTTAPRQCKLQDQDTLACNAMGFGMLFKRVK